MSEQDKPNNGNLMPAGRRDLVPIASGNPLVSRGFAELANIAAQTPDESLYDLCKKVTESIYDVSKKFKAWIASLWPEDSSQASRHACELAKAAERQAYQLLTARLRAKSARSVAGLGLSKRVRMCLDRLGIKSSDELTSCTPDELLESKNFGMTCLTEVRGKLRELDLVLRGD